MGFDPQRLAQRKLAQWALAYAAGAWVALPVLAVSARPIAYPGRARAATP